MNEAIDRFDGRSPRAWLLTIVRNTHFNGDRRRRSELLRDPDTQLERLAHAETADAQAPTVLAAMTSRVVQVAPSQRS